MVIPDQVWIIFLAALGACIGSFLNVVIHRLPRDQSLVSPPSHCPGCKTPIRWYDNIPIASYLMLGGKCRSCKTTISIRYTLIELSTALAFVALYDAFFKSAMHVGLQDPILDFPIFAVYLALAAVLILCSALDIEYYLIDLRIIYIMIAAALLGWAFGWRTDHNYLWPTTGTGLFAVSIGVVIGEAVRRIVAAITGHTDQVHDDEFLESDQADDQDQPTGKGLWELIFAYAFVALGIALIVWSIVSGDKRIDYDARAWSYIGWLFLAIVVGCIPHRQSDKQIVEIIEQEKSTARSVAIGELIMLMPATIGGAAMIVLMKLSPAFKALIGSVFDLQIGTHLPVVGLAAGVGAMVVAVAFGWSVRIGFTLLFGKEAMGIGDIYILAAVAAAAGPTVAIVGFFAGSVIGVFGIALLLLWKTSSALSYGPWIAIGTMVCLLFYKPLVNTLAPAALGIRDLILGH